MTAALAACTSLLAIGFGLGRALRPAAPPLIIERKVTTDVLTARGERAAEAGGGGEAALQTHGPDGTTEERPTDPLEVVSICGARTKKGTPCSRRVRGAGRCWQHRGKPAMLPQEKLVVPD